MPTVIPSKKLDKNVYSSKLKLMMRKNTTFYSALLANLKQEYTDDVPTAATDGVTMWLNPEFAEKLPVPQLTGLLLHEVMHCVLDHMDRRKSADLDPLLYNVAGDHRINNDLTLMGYELPEGGLCDAKYRNAHIWSTRKIYDDLEEQGQSFDGFTMDIIIPGSGDGKEDDEAASEHREQVLSNVIKAVQQAEMANDAGSVPGHVKRRLEEVLNPVLPWQIILINHMDNYVKDDYRWTRPNRRYLPDFYLPSLDGEALKQLSIGFDVSASMSDKDVAVLMPEIRYIWEMLRPRSLRLMSFDTIVHDDLTFNEGDFMDDVVLHGGGGTDVTPFIESLRKEAPELALIFSDGYFSMPNMKGLSTDIFWIIKNNPGFTAPYGTVVYYDAED